MLCNEVMGGRAAEFVRANDDALCTYPERANNAGGALSGLNARIALTNRRDRRSAAFSSCDRRCRTKLRSGDAPWA
jgi:hypothetical protein